MPVSIVLTASMRPRVFPAEDDETTQSGYGGCPCFNEAAGIPRGRRTMTSGMESGASRFNEAAGIPRGRLITKILYL